MPPVSDRLMGYPSAAAAYTARRRAPSRVGIVIHSGAVGRNVKRYLCGERPEWRREVLARKVNCHFAHDGEQFWQLVGLLWVSNHAGSPWNDLCYGIEMPGPYGENPRREIDKAQTIKLVKDLRAEDPGLEWITGHQFITDDRKDPGPGVDPSWWDGLGLDVRWERWRWTDPA